jgi:hypothetical protein
MDVVYVPKGERVGARLVATPVDAASAPNTAGTAPPVSGHARSDAHPRPVITKITQVAPEDDITFVARLILNHDYAKSDFARAAFTSAEQLVKVLGKPVLVTLLPPSSRAQIIADFETGGNGGTVDTHTRCWVGTRLFGTPA